MLNQITRKLIIEENIFLAKSIYLMRLVGDVSEIKHPGQFINIKLDGFFLRRPISVYDCGKDSVSIVYKTVGEGTAAMSELKKGDSLDVMLGLGNGFDMKKSGSRPLLIGGGVGAPPMYYLAKCLLLEGKSPRVILGFNSAEDVILLEEFRAIGVETEVTTVDGSVGKKGFVTGLCDGSQTFYYACGPEAMLKAVYETCGEQGELSFESRMGCGFGACMGCSCHTKYGAKRICTDGPVLDGSEVIF